MSYFCRYSCTNVQRSMKISGFTLQSSGPVSLGSFKPHTVKLIPCLPNTPCIHCNWCSHSQIFLVHFNEELYAQCGCSLNISHNRSNYRKHTTHVPYKQTLSYEKTFLLPSHGNMAVAFPWLWQPCSFQCTVHCTWKWYLGSCCVRMFTISWCDFTYLLPLVH